MSKRAVSLALVSLVIGTPSALADDRFHDDQQFVDWRESFRAVHPSAELGDWGPAEARRQQLEDYVLWPDLEAAWLRATIANVDHSDIDDFLAAHGVLKPARDLRYRYALHLASIGHLAEYQRVYEQFYQGQEIAKLDCLLYRTNINFRLAAVGYAMQKAYAKFVRTYISIYAVERLNLLIV